MYVQLPSDDNTMMNVVRRIIINAMPSMPMAKRTPHDGIHGISTANCQRASDGSNAHHRPNETMNSTRKVSKASVRAGPATPVAISSTAVGGSTPARAAAVNPVGTVLVGQHALEAFLQSRLALRHETLRFQHDPRDENTGDRDGEGDTDERILESRSRLGRSAVSDAQRRFAKDRLEPSIQQSDAAKLDRLRNIEPSTDDAQDAKHHQRPGHDPRRLAEGIALALTRSVCSGEGVEQHAHHVDSGHECRGETDGVACVQDDTARNA